MARVLMFNNISEENKVNSLLSTKFLEGISFGIFCSFLNLHTADAKEPINKN